MVKITLDIEGMACGMCEAHINEVVRRAFTVKKVTSSHRSGTTEIFAEIPIEHGELKNAIEATGYKVRGIHTEPFEKKGLSRFRK